MDLSGIIVAGRRKDVSRLGVVNTAGTDRQSPLGLFPEQPKPRLYDCVVEGLRTRHYSRRTEQAYIHWIRRFISFHAPNRPRQLREGNVNRFLTHLAHEGSSYKQGGCGDSPRIRS